jgi:hypothetical protein
MVSEEQISRNPVSNAIMLIEGVELLIFKKILNIHSWSLPDIIQEGRMTM